MESALQERTLLHVVWDKPIQGAVDRVCQCMSVLQKRLGKPIFPCLKTGCLFPTFLFWKRQDPVGCGREGTELLLWTHEWKIVKAEKMIPRLDFLCHPSEDGASCSSLSEHRSIMVGRGFSASQLWHEHLLQEQPAEAVQLVQAAKNLSVKV